jgi:GH24 family phage-related lysozyme (muramidase)
MSAVDIALPLLKTDEGFRALPYKDTKGLETIGYGFCVSRGISQRAAAALLQEQTEETHEELLRYGWYAQLDDVRQSACLNIAINEGVGGLLHFPKMIAGLARKDWQNAASECQVEDPNLKPRYTHLGQILLTGVAS